jgi:hypothetical protein
MKKQFIWIIISVITLSACQNKKVLTDSADWDKVYKKVDPKAIRENPIKLIHGWMLVTTANKQFGKAFSGNLMFRVDFVPPVSGNLLKAYALCTDNPFLS